MFLLLGVLLAALAFGGVLFALRQNSAANNINIVVAKANIPAGTTLTADLVTTASVPAAAKPADAFTDSAAVISKTTTVSISQNTPFVPAFFAAPPVTAASSGAGSAAVSLATQITKGYVAVAIPGGTALPKEDQTTTGVGGDQVSVGYYILPGDHIDILINIGNGGVRFSFQDLPVLRVGAAGGTGNGGASVYVVEVPRSQVELLTSLVTEQGAQQGGTGHTPYVLKYVLRPQSEWGKMAPDGSKYEPNYQNATGPGLPTPQDNTVTPGTLDSIFGH